MTLRCPQCGGPVRIDWDNGAEYPETRVEGYKCQDCGHEFTKTLTA